MIGQRAAKTETEFAAACDCRNDPTEVTLFCTAFHSELAIWSWTPLQVVFIINVSAREQYLVSIRESTWDLEPDLCYLPCLELCCN